MPPAWRVALAFLLLAAGAAQAESQLSAAHEAVFEKNVAPFLQQHCFKCHSAEAEKAGKLKGKFRVDTIPAQGAPERWKAVAEQLAMGDMPPEKEPRPGAHAVERVIAWLGGEMAKAGLDLSAVEAKRQLPQHANRVDHDLLFGGTINLPAASPPRLWRMSPFLYSGFSERIGRTSRLNSIFARRDGSAASASAGAAIKPRNAGRGLVTGTNFRINFAPRPEFLHLESKRAIATGQGPEAEARSQYVSISARRWL